MDQELITAITDACEALHNLEMVAHDDNQRLSDKTRLMLDTLEGYLRTIDPQYS